MTLLATWVVLDDAERRARLRCLQGLVRVLAGPAGRELAVLLCAAETDTQVLAACDAALDAIGTIPMRRILATFAATLPTKGKTLPIKRRPGAYAAPFAPPSSMDPVLP